MLDSARTVHYAGRDGRTGPVATVIPVDAPGVDLRDRAGPRERSPNSFPWRQTLGLAAGAIIVMTAFAFL
jgi:hypothetical protein